MRDIKTGYARSALPNGHARQLSLYGSALRKTPYVDYVSKSKVTSFEVKNLEFYVHECFKIINSMARILSISDDIVECCQFLPYPNKDHWMFGTTTKDAMKDIWQ